MTTLQPVLLGLTGLGSCFLKQTFCRPDSLLDGHMQDLVLMGSEDRQNELYLGG